MLVRGKLVVGCLLNMTFWWLRTKVVRVTDDWGRRSDGVEL